MSARWRPQDDRALAALYQAGTPLCDIARRLARSEDAVTSRRRQLGIARRRRAWTPAQDALIVSAAHAGLPMSEVAAHLGLPAERVRRRRRELVGRRAAGRRYSAAEDETIRDAWSSGRAVQAVADELGRSADALRLRARHLGLHQPDQRPRWTSAEDDALRLGYRAGMDCRRIARDALPGRSLGAIAARAAKLGLANHGRRWSIQDDRLVVAMLAREAPVSVIAARLVRSDDAVRQRARRLGVAHQPAGIARHGVRWTADEDRRLREITPGALPELSCELGRSEDAVRARMARLGLVSAGSRSPHRPLAAVDGLLPAQRRLAVAAGEDAAAMLVVARRLRTTPGRLAREVRSSVRKAA